MIVPSSVPPFVSHTGISIELLQLLFYGCTYINCKPWASSTLSLLLITIASSALALVLSVVLLMYDLHIQYMYA